MTKSLTAAFTSGLRTPNIKAAISGWLGLPTTQIPGYWSGWSTSSFLSKSVSVDQALQLSTVWACVRLISGTIATLPLGFYQRNTDGSRTAATKHDLYNLLHSQPNGSMTAVVFWEVVVASLLLWGNAYIEIIRSGNSIVALHFIHPARITMRRLARGGYVYHCRDDDTSSKEREISEENMMHIPAFSTDGVVGLSPIIYGTNVFGTAIETDKSSALTFQGAMRSPGIITTKATLSDARREQIRGHAKTVSDTGGVMVMEEGTSFQKLGFDPVSAELLASREWNVEEMCRWYDTDPSMVGHGGKDSNFGTGLEQKMLWFISFTLRRWCVRIEQAVRKDLLTPVERMKLFAEFNMDGLLRGDSAARASYLSTMWQNGGMTRNEGRAKDNLPPMPGGDDLTVQSNLLPIQRLGENVPTPQDRRETDQLNRENIRSEFNAMAAIIGKQQLTVDARTTVNSPPNNVNVTSPEIHLTTPEHKPAPINVDARTTVNNPASAPVTVNVPETKAPDVKVEVAAPVMNVAAPEVTVNIEASDGEKVTTYKRDPDTNEILSSRTKRDDAIHAT